MSSNLFLDQSGPQNVEPPELWKPLIIRKEDIDAEIERLADMPLPSNGRRQSAIIHPQSSSSSLGLAPGIRVTLNVLKAGERTTSFRHNATEVNFCIQGEGHCMVGGKRIDFKQFDVWNHPSYVPYWHVNDSDDLQVRLTYSNAAMLEKMNVYIAEENPLVCDKSTTQNAGIKKDEASRTSPYGTFQITEDGAYLMPYETVINPKALESKALHWPWEKVKHHLDRLESLGEKYTGRRLYLLYNPRTLHTNGTTPSFFATITIRPTKIIDRPHRHVSAAINYYFKGQGYSVVEGERYEWKSGDLMLSAPGWATHNHASYDEPVYELTVQDQPLNLAMESLLWQEDMKSSTVVLGSHTGFDTNREAISE